MKLGLILTLSLLTFFVRSEEKKYDAQIDSVVLAIPESGLRVTLSLPDKVTVKTAHKPAKTSVLKAAEMTEALALASQIAKSVPPGNFSHKMKESYTLYLQPNNGTSSYEYSLHPGTENPMPEALEKLLKKLTALGK